MCLCYLFSAKNCMTISESKGRFFYITNRIESIRIANWNVLVDGVERGFLSPSSCEVKGQKIVGNTTDWSSSPL